MRVAGSRLYQRRLACTVDKSKKYQESRWTVDRTNFFFV